jgi:hypothetical protein
MNFVLFAWFVSTDIFESMSNMQLKDLLYQEKLMEMEEDLPPFGFMDAGNEKPDSLDHYDEIIQEMERWKSL